MRKVWIKIVLAVALLCGGAFAAFIQSPIPPSSKQNFFRDTDGDGRMDRIVLRFLGAISQEYLEQMVDSLDFTWIDSTGLVSRYMIPASKMRVDSASVRQVLVDLDQKDFEQLTTLSSIYMPVQVFIVFCICNSRQQCFQNFVWNTFFRKLQNVNGTVNWQAANHITNQI